MRPPVKKAALLVLRAASHATTKSRAMYVPRVRIIANGDTVRECYAHNIILCASVKVRVSKSICFSMRLIIKYLAVACHSVGDALAVQCCRYDTAGISRTLARREQTLDLWVHK